MVPPHAHYQVVLLFFFNLAPLHILQVPLPAAASSLAAHHRTAAWLQPSQFCHIILVLHLVYISSRGLNALFLALQFSDSYISSLKKELPCGQNWIRKKKNFLSRVSPLLSYELKLITHPSLCLLAVCVLVPSMYVSFLIGISHQRLKGPL